MNFKPDDYHLTMGLLLVFLAFLAYRFVRIFLRRQRQLGKPPRTQSDLLMDALKERTLGERQAVADHLASAQALQAMRILHSHVIEHLPVGIAVLEDNGAIAYANQLSVHWLGDQPEQGGLANWSVPLAEFFNQQKQAAEPDAQLLEITQDERRKTYLASLTGLPDQRWMLTMQDQTRMLRLEEQIRVKRDLALMGEMASGITHEVKNALAVIQGNLQMLQYGDVGAHSQQIQSEVDRLLTCVSQFMKSSKGEAPHLVAIPIDDFMNRLQDHWRSHHQSHRVLFEGPEKMGTIYGDMAQLLILFNNLIINGLQACEAISPEGVWVRVHVRAGVDHHGILVDDFGPGFSADVMEKLFVPFVSTKEKGSGFGLFHCRRMMLQHQGNIEVDQGPPTRVACYFPRTVNHV